MSCIDSDVSAATGTAAAASNDTPAGFDASLSSVAQTYSANDVPREVSTA
jgi:hypothetical protein